MINQLATLPLSSAQQRILLIEQLFPNTPIHNLSGASVYEFDVDFALLKNAVNLFVKHHDAARIRFFINENNEIEQFVSDYATINIEIFDFSEKENPQRSFELWSKTESLKVFDWRESELIRFSFFLEFKTIELDISSISTIQSPMGGLFTSWQILFQKHITN